MASMHTIPRRRRARHTRWVQDAAFCLTLSLAVVAGGGAAALTGLPLLSRWMAPGSGPTRTLERVAFVQAPAHPWPHAPAILPATRTAGSGGATELGPRIGGAAAAHMPAIAIVMDDLGPDVTATRQAEHLPAAVTLSFLPYARDVAKLATESEAEGHEVIVHVPMQPDGSDDPGPRALRVDSSAPANERRLAWDLSRVPGADGINNHMGSRFTADGAALVPVLARLASTGDFFFDSRTTPRSKVVALARDFGILSAGRDVFLDDVQSRAYVLGQLQQLLHVAQQDGVAIAIGHPHAVTLDVLQHWIRAHPGVRLIDLRQALRLKSRKAQLRTAMAQTTPRLIGALD